MSWNGTGTYVLNPLFTPEAPGNVVDSTRYNGALTDIANGITASLAKNGENVPTANLGMGGFKHTNVAAASVAGEYVEYAQMLALTAEINVLATTVYIIGSGTHTFNASAKTYKYVVVGGGGAGAGGGTGTATGGSAGETVEGTAFVINASETYAVGAAVAGGAGAGTAGNRTRFGTIVAQGGKGGLQGAVAGPTGGGAAASPAEGRTPGGAGGYGGSAPPTAAASGGRAPGYPTALTAGAADDGTTISTGNTSGNRCGGGGSSLYGTGGNGSNGATAGGSGTGYGSAGGGSDSGVGGAGAGGYIKIVEFG